MLTAWPWHMPVWLCTHSMENQEEEFPLSELSLPATLSSAGWTTPRTTPRNIPWSPNRFFTAATVKIGHAMVAVISIHEPGRRDHASGSGGGRRRPRRCVCVRESGVCGVWCVVCGVWCVVCGVEGGDGVSTGQRTRMTDELVVINRPQLPASLAHPQPRHALCCHRDSDRRRRRRCLAFGITGSLGGGGGVPGYLVRHFPARDAPGSASNESLCARTSRAAPAQAISSSVPLRATAHAGLRRRCHGGIRREARADATADPAILLGVPMHAVSPGMHQPRHAATCSLPPHTTRADARQHARQPLPAQGQRSRRRGSESEPLLVHGTAAQPRAPRRRADAVLHVG
jgi:hypothetical protein